MGIKVVWRAPYLWVTVLTLGIAGAMFYSFHTGRSMAERYAPLMGAAVDIKFEATAAHLWFEEIISGDPFIDIEDVWKHLDQAEWYARVMLEGGENQQGKYIPLEDPALREGIMQTLEGIKAFRTIARERWDKRSQSGVGSDIDQRFDKTYDDFLVHADDVETVLRQTMNSQLLRFRLTQGLLIVIIGILGIFVGVVLHRHERRRTSDIQALQDREQNLSTTLNSIGDGVIATDTSGNIIRMNPVAETLTGWHATDAVGRPLSEVFKIINAQSRETIADPIERVLRTGRIVGLDNHTVLISKGSVEYQIADSGAPIRAADGTITGVVLVFRDVTQEYGLQAALKENQHQLQSILDNTPAVIYVKDLDGRFLLINRQFENLFNITNEKIQGLTGHDIFPRDVADKFRNNDIQVVKTRSALEVEEVAPHKDGLHTYFSVKFPLFDREHTLHAICGISTDITERLQSEEALLRAQKMEAIGHLSGGVAHDFNNQLGIIIGYLDFLKHHYPADEKLHQWVDTASKATLRCIDLTRQLLAFSRQQAREMTVVDLNTLLRELETMVARSVTPEVEVQYSLAEDLELTEIDPGEFHDAILNLVINARDAMPGGGKLLIETSNKYLDADYVSRNPEVKVGDYVQFILSDTGTGMDKETQLHIFEPFFTTKSKGKGTGLGLAMVYGFVKRYGGSIMVYSEPGVGTAMHLYLPRSTSTESVAVVKKAHQTELPTGSESILIVDDEGDLLQLADSYLRSLGYHTRTAENGAQALAILEEDETLNLLFSDVVMPGGMNGFELAQQATQQRSGLRVLLTSGFASKTMTGNSQARFSSHFLSKPYRKEELAQRIRLVLDQEAVVCINPN